MKIYKLFFWIWAVVIVTLSSVPSLKIPLKDGISWDKLAHFSEYLILSFLYYKLKFQSGYSVQSIKTHLIYMLFTIPLLDELHQLLIPGRQFSFYDIVADMLGFSMIILYLELKTRKMAYAKSSK